MDFADDCYYRTSYSSLSDFESTSAFWHCAWVTTNSTCADASQTPSRCNRWRHRHARTSSPNKLNGTYA